MMDLPNKSVLIADDSAFIRSLVRKLLHSFGVGEILEADNGKSALTLIQQAKPHLLIADWEMGPIDGLQLVRFLRRSPHSPDPFIPIIVMTGFPSRERVLAARDSGANEFLVKPIAPSALASRLNALLAKPQPFIKGQQYFGPDRRRHDPAWNGNERREQETPAILPPAAKAEEDMTGS